MKSVNLLPLCLIVLLSCVSQSEYDRMEAEKMQMEAELNDLKYGAATLLKKAKTSAGSGEWDSAIAHLNELVRKYPQDSLVDVAQQLIKQYKVKQSLAQEEVVFNSAISGSLISNCDDYLNQYPNGRFVSQVKTKKRALVVAQEEDRYREANQINSAGIWRQFLNTYPNRADASEIRDRIIRLEVDEIMAGEHGDLPPFSSTGRNYGSSISTVSIKNDTGYELTIRYSGPEAAIVTIPSGGTRSVTLVSGTYKIAASVNASNVRNYAGTESLSGSYNSSYYISSSSY